MADSVVNNTKKTFDCGNNVSDVLKTLVKPYTYVWKTTLKFSSDLDVTIKEI